MWLTSDQAQERNALPGAPKQAQQRTLGDALVERRPHEVEREVEEPAAQLDPLAGLQGRPCPGQHLQAAEASALSPRCSKKAGPAHLAKSKAAARAQGPQEARPKMPRADTAAVVRENAVRVPPFDCYTSLHFEAAVSLLVHRTKDGLKTLSEACFFLVGRSCLNCCTKTVCRHVYEANMLEACEQIILLSCLQQTPRLLALGPTAQSTL